MCVSVMLTLCLQSCFLKEPRKKTNQWMVQRWWLTYLDQFLGSPPFSRGYCWWFRNPANLLSHHLQGFMLYTSQVVVFGISSNNSMDTFWVIIKHWVMTSLTFPIPQWKNFPLSQCLRLVSSWTTRCGQDTKTGWWLNQPIWKVQVKLEIFPK